MLSRAEGTFTQGLRIVPVGVSRVDALDDGGTLLQRVAGVTGELHHSPHPVGGISGAEVAILDVRLVAVALLESCPRRITETKL